MEYLSRIFIQISLLLSFVSFAHSQSNQNVIVTNCSGPAMCDGAATVIGSSLNTTYTNFLWFHNSIYMDMGSNISNLCPGNYTLQAYGNGVSSNINFTVGPTSNVPCLGFQIS